MGPYIVHLMLRARVCLLRLSCAGDMPPTIKPSQVYDLKKNVSQGFGEMFVQYLSSKHESLSSVFRTYVEKLGTGLDSQCWGNNRRILGVYLNQ